jgi:hypothetical protein
MGGKYVIFIELYLKGNTNVTPVKTNFRIKVGNDQM